MFHSLAKAPGSSDSQMDWSSATQQRPIQPLAALSLGLAFAAFAWARPCLDYFHR